MDRRDGGYTMRMPRVSHRLLAVVLGVVMEELRLGTEELAVAVNGTREGLREPVERCAVEHLIHTRGLVGPLLELLSDPEGLSAEKFPAVDQYWVRSLPCQKCNRTGRQHKSNGRGSGTVLTSVCVAHSREIVDTVETLLLMRLHALGFFVAFGSDADGEID